jgi:tRNA(Ile)-lysidine synthase
VSIERVAPLVQVTRQAARRLGLDDGRTLVAVSGGVDSTVLLELLGGFGFDLAVGHVNHGLRGAASDADEAHVKDLAQARGLPLEVRRVAPLELIEDQSSRTRPTVQEAARRVRYDALQEIADETGCTRIATAHHRDDQAETVMLRLLRGASPEGLGGIPESSSDGKIVRPLLDATRAEIEHFAEQRGLSWREDLSNQDPRYARARLRSAGWGQIAAELNPNWLRAVGDLAEAQRRENEWIAEIVEQQAAERFLPHGQGFRIVRDGWQATPEALARRLARWLLRKAGGPRDVSRIHILRVVKFLRTARPGLVIELPGALELRREREAFWLEPASETPKAGSGEPSVSC